MSKKVEIWREQKVGKRRGRTVKWDEDLYKVLVPRMKKETVPKLDSKGEQIEEILGVRYGADGEIAHKETGLVFEDLMVPVLDEKGEQVFDVLYEGIVTDSFIQHNAEAYKTFIEENGERKDERY